MMDDFKTGDIIIAILVGVLILGLAIPLGIVIWTLAIEVVLQHHGVLK